MKQHIFLSGFMGAGKSKVAPLIARRFIVPVFDTDHLIEAAEGRSIREIFDQDGEYRFRAVEKSVVRELIQGHPAVISLGGGALLDPALRSEVYLAGIVVYIKSSPENILPRISRNRKRPLLDIPEGPDFEERLLQKITTLLDSRRDIYEQAHIIVDRDAMDSESLAREIINQCQRIWK